MKVYKKKNGKFIVISNRNSGKFGGTEVIFLNYSLKGSLQAISNFNDYEYLRNPTLSEIDMYYNKLNHIDNYIIRPTVDDIKIYSK